MAAATEWQEGRGIDGGLVMQYSRSELNSRRRANLKRAGVKESKTGPGTHTATYHLAQYGDINDLTRQSGHANTDVLWRHYYQAATKEETKRYWSVVPQKVNSNVVAFSA